MLEDSIIQKNLFATDNENHEQKEITNIPEDLSLEDLKKKVAIHKPKAVWVVHIGGHISFQIEEIAKFCKKKRFDLASN